MHADGTVNAVRLGDDGVHLGDLYHALRRASWTKLVLGIGVFYLLSNGVFALIYLAGGNCIAQARPGSFADAFFFSVQTMSTIGYGSLSPIGTYANLVVTVEATFGLLLTAMTTGLVFAKFSTPTARILFSRHVVIGTHDGFPTLMLRVGNERSNQIVEAHVRVSLARDEVLSDGETVRRFHDLPLLRSSTPLFQMTWSIYHPIDTNSPLAGATAETLERWRASILVSINGIDESLMQSVHARHAYDVQDIVWNARFADILRVGEDGLRTIDYRRFHDLEPPR
jgi:inward rectifier potassium channel